MFGDSSTGGVFGGGGGLGDVLPEHVPSEGFEDLMEQAPGAPPMPQQAAAGPGMPMPPPMPMPGQSVREVPRRQPAPSPGMPPGAVQQAASGVGAYQVPLAQTKTKTSGGSVLAAFLGGVLAAGVGYGAWRMWQAREGE